MGGIFSETLGMKCSRAFPHAQADRWEEKEEPGDVAAPTDEKGDVFFL